MKRILLVLTILGGGAVAFLAVRQSTIQLEREANVTREAWLAQTQLVAAAEGEQVNLAVRVRELKQTLAQAPAVADSGLWSALRTNRADHLPRHVSERLVEELGFNWHSSPEFLVVTKQTLRDTGAWMFTNGTVSEVAAAVLAITPEERGQVEAALQRGQADFNAWALANVERKEPSEGELAHYALPADPAMVQSIRSNLFAVCSDTLGRGRAGMMQPSLQAWMNSEIGVGGEGATLIIKGEQVGDEQRLKAEVKVPGIGFRSGHFPEFDLTATFRPIFPNGWADVAKMEGFELPPPEKK